MVKREIKILKSNSFFLFGARGTGKSTLLRELFPQDEAVWIDLLDPEEEQNYQLNPNLLKERLLAYNPLPEWVVIDEVQRAPKMLDVVHSLIAKPENSLRNLKFAMTGSCARKLKRGANNLLAGRAFTYELYPLTFKELGAKFDLMSALTWGTLPLVTNLTTAAEKKAFLRSYTNTYLKEEILQEQLIRKVAPFRKFLPIAAQRSGTIINLNNIAKDLRVDWTTVRNYFEILKDTLIGFLLPAYPKSLRKQQLNHPKFYLFDVGIKRAFDNTLTVPLAISQIIGSLFEHFIICELKRLNSYLQKDFTLYYLSTQGGLEIDLIIERPNQKSVLIEIKSSNEVKNQHLKHLAAIADESDEFEALCFSQEKRARKVGKITVLPWQEGFRRLGLIL
jgi:uncharacterized protein